MENYQEIIIDWHAKEQVKTIEDFIKITSLIDEPAVLYQIYGDHHIYGRNVLLYIGISKNVNARFSSHLKGVFQFVNNKSVSIGRIVNTRLEELEIPESILIANHKPAFNKEYIHSIDSNAVKNKIIIINNGVNEMLNTCCTNFWWVDHKNSAESESLLEAKKNAIKDQDYAYAANLRDEMNG